MTTADPLIRSPRVANRSLLNRAATLERKTSLLRFRLSLSAIQSMVFYFSESINILDRSCPFDTICHKQHAADT